MTYKNIKYLLILLIALFVSTNSNAQNKTVGSFYAEQNILKIEYKEISIYTAGLINEDKTTLYISDDYTFCKTEFLEKNFSSEDIMASDELTILVVEDDSEDFNEVYLNRKNNTLTEYLSENRILKKKFAVEESQPQMKWELLSQQKKISNYTCEKAKTTFRGRTYEVWYTPEIPIPSGPWKFNGLPGLILSVKDLEGIYSWAATSIKTISSNEFNISDYLNNKKDFTKISYKDFDEKVINALKERNRMQNTRGEDNLKFGFSTSTQKEPINEWRTQTYFE